MDAILRRPEKLWFDQSDCVEVDYCANAVLTALVVDARRFYNVSCGGNNPIDPEANEIVRATGLPAALTGRPTPRTAEFVHYPLRQGHKSPKNSTLPSDRGRHTTSLTEYVNGCLSRFGFELTADSAEYFSSLTAEVIDNAEQHSSSNRWWVGGYLRLKGEEKIGDCHLVIFNVGRCISESLQDLPAEAALRAGLERIAARHRPRWFRPAARWSEADLWTLYAMQQGVSRKNGQPEGTPLGDRGQGTADMITMFQALGRTKNGKDEPVMSVVSGRTYLRFDSEYSMISVPDPDGKPRRLITFNAEGSLDYPPDSSKVRQLDHHFPGTLISLRFYLDKRHLEEIHDANKPK